MCQEFCPQGGCVSQNALGQTPPCPVHDRIHTLHPLVDTFLGRHPSGQTPPVRQTHPWADIPPPTSPWADTCPHPLRRKLQLTVRILLECILVKYLFSQNDAKDKGNDDILNLGLLHGDMAPQRALNEEQIEWMAFPHRIFLDYLCAFFIMSLGKVNSLGHVKTSSFLICSSSHLRWVEIFSKISPKK